VGEGLLTQVVGPQTAEGVDRADEKRRAEGRQRPRARLERLARLLDERLQRRRVGDLGLASALDDHRLEVLGTEHGADAATARHALTVLPVMRHGGETDTG